MPGNTQLAIPMGTENLLEKNAVQVDSHGVDLWRISGSGLTRTPDTTFKTVHNNLGFSDYYMKSIITILAILLGINNCFAEETTLPVGTKNKFFCQINDLGIARLYAANPLAEVSINQRITAWSRKKRRLESLPPAEKAARSGRISELRRMINNARTCKRGNQPINACSIFTPNQLRNPSTRIIDGAECSGANSAIVYLDMFTEFDEQLGACTGTVVADRVIISAAHCLADDGSGEAAAVDIYDLNGEYLTTATDLHIHDSYYDSFSAGYDLSVIKTDEDLGTGVIPIHTTNDLVTQEVAAIAGYGQDENDGAGVLKAGFSVIFGTPDNVIRARYLPGAGSNTCFGDSGGPLLVYRNSAWRLAGATSDGSNETCGVDGRPDTSRWVNISAPENQAFLQDVAPELFD